MTLKQELEDAFSGYVLACYGDKAKLGKIQLAEIRQAFFSGVIWLIAREGVCCDMVPALRQICNVPDKRDETPWD